MAFQHYMKYALALLMLLAAIASGKAQERILNFHSDLELATDATLHVRETIRISCALQQISHGIFRELATHYRDRQGKWVTLWLHSVQAQRDGAPETIRRVNITNGTRIYLGNPNCQLASGIYTYALTYDVTGAVSTGARQELYWNVTGYTWSFPIEQATASLTLSASVRPSDVQVSAYSGPLGIDTGNNSAWIDHDSRCQYGTTGPLNSGEALIITANFPRVLRPAIMPAAACFNRMDPALKYGLFGLVLVSGYYLLVWRLVGRRPAPSPHNRPRFTPPDGLPPAALRYLWRMGYDTKVLAVTLIDLSAGGLLTLVNHGKDFRLESDQTFYWDAERRLLHELGPGIPVDYRTLAKRLDERVADISAMVTALIRKGIPLEVVGRTVRLLLTDHSTIPVQQGKLSTDALRLAYDLLGPSHGLRLDENASPVVQTAIKHQRSYLAAKYERRYFNSNSRYLLPGILLSLVVIGYVAVGDFSCIIPTTTVTASAATHDSGSQFLWFFFFQTFGRPIISALVSVVVAFLTEALVCKRGAKHYIVLGALIVFPVALMIFLQSKFTIFNHFPIVFLLVVFLIWGLNLLFYHLLKAPTKLGQQLLDHIQEFRAYLLNPTIRLRIAGEHVPAETLATFEHYLPFAVALDAEHPWIEHFEKRFTGSQPGVMPFYLPWFTGGRLGQFDAKHLICALNDDLANAISLAALGKTKRGDTSASHSSGTSGSSGGGGGGGIGGGGGW